MENCGKMDVFDRTEPDHGGKLVKWTFLTGLNRTMVENCGKMDVFDQIDPDYGGLVA